MARRHGLTGRRQMTHGRLMTPRRRGRAGSCRRRREIELPPRAGAPLRLRKGSPAAIASRGTSRRTAPSTSRVLRSGAPHSSAGGYGPTGLSQKRAAPQDAARAPPARRAHTLLCAPPTRAMGPPRASSLRSGNPRPSGARRAVAGRQPLRSTGWRRRSGALGRNGGSIGLRLHARAGRQQRRGCGDQHERGEVGPAHAAKRRDEGLRHPGERRAARRVRPPSAAPSRC